MSRFEHLPSCGVGLGKLGQIDEAPSPISKASLSTTGEMSSLLRVEGVPMNVSEACWDVILVDAPAGYNLVRATA